MGFTLPPKWYQFLVGVFASLGSFLYGYDLGVIAEVVASETFAAKFVADDVQSGVSVLGDAQNHKLTISSSWLACSLRGRSSVPPLQDLQVTGLVEGSPS